MTTVTLPRLDIPITGRSPINSEWYRWARDITARTGGVEALNSDDLLQAPPLVSDVSTSVAETSEVGQSPPVLPQISEARLEQYAPAVLPQISEVTPEQYAPPVLPMQTLCEVPEQYMPPVLPAQECIEWQTPAVYPVEERVEWLENRVMQLHAQLESLSLLVAGLQQGITA
jgi:hypothetical protein